MEIESVSQGIKNTDAEMRDAVFTDATKIAGAGIPIIKGAPGVVYFLQPTIPLGNNLTQTLTNTAANKDFIPASNQGATGLLFTDDAKVQKVTLILLGNAVNVYAGSNALDCTTASHNQLQIAMDGGGFVDLVNGTKPDGQLLDNDWRCKAEGVIFSFAYPFDVTSQVTNIDGNIGIRLANGRAEQSSLKVTILTAVLNVLWKV